MAQIKSQKKDIIKNRKNNLRNVSYKSTLRTAIKRVQKSVDDKDLARAEIDLKTALGIIDRSKGLGIQKENTVNRQKTHVWRLVNDLKTALATDGEKAAAVKPVEKTAE